MNDIDVNRVLTQIRALRSQAELRPPAAEKVQESQGGFATLLKESIDRVNQTQSESVRLQEAFTRGDKDVDLSSVMLAGAKAQVGFKAMVEVRNRLVNAYQEIMNMPV